MKNLLSKSFTLKGFTLAELLLAAALLIFALTSLLLVFINCIFLNTASRNLSIASGHAQYALEELKNKDFASIASQTWDTAAITSRGLTALSAESIIIDVGGGIEPLTVTITVNWKDRSVRQRSIALNTLITEP